MAGQPFVFVEKDWKTENTYNKNYAPVPARPGVYLLVNTGFDLQHEILYVGSSKNLKQRRQRHEVLRVLSEMYSGYGVRFYFKEEADYLSVEKQLIKQIQARFNTQWR
jgi:excinuclease UvrABC nuclease subunit